MESHHGDCVRADAEAHAIARASVEIAGYEPRAGTWWDEAVDRLASIWSAAASVT